MDRACTPPCLIRDHNTNRSAAHKHLMQMEVWPFAQPNSWGEVNIIIIIFQTQTAFAFALPFINGQIKFAPLLHLDSLPLMSKPQHY